METKPLAVPKPGLAKKPLWRRLLMPVLFTLGFFAVLEVSIRVAYAIRNAQVTAVPLPFVIGHDYGPLPPWLADLMILAPDDDLVWKSRPNLRRRYVDIFSPVRNDEERRALLRRFWPSLPDAWQDNPSWEIALNSQGFRGDEFAPAKAACRVVCLGDSWTFGMNVGQEQTYPRRLHALLTEAFPRTDIEVLNLGVLGYSSHQGLELLKTRALDLNPDVVVIGFAMNDAKVNEVRGSAQSDTALAAYEKSPTFGDRAGRLLRKSEIFNLLAYLAQLTKFEPQPIGQYLRKEAGDDNENEGGGNDAEEQNGEGGDPYEWLKWARVPLGDYEQNVRAMVRLARARGALAVLLYNELWPDGPYLKVLMKVAASEKVPIVDSSALIAQARGVLERELERKLGLEPAGAGGPVSDNEAELVFRVYLGDRPLPRGVFIAGTHPKLGDAEPNRVALYDDGTHGDQKANDGVWSVAATFRPGTELHYVYTNSGGEGRWEGLDVPHIREVRVEESDRGQRVYLPVETFGKIVMQADGWHPNAEGYELIARALFNVLKGDGKVKDAARPGVR